jgi:hypothetical protein
MRAFILSQDLATRLGAVLRAWDMPMADLSSCSEAVAIWRVRS